MKKIISISICVGLLMTAISPCFANESAFVPQNNDLYSKYLNQLDASQTVYTRSNYNIETLLDRKNEMLPMFEDTSSTEFDELFDAIPCDNEDIELVDSFADDNMASVISKDYTTNALYYMEGLSNREEALFIVNGMKYIIYTEGEDILLQSENGDVLYLVKTELIDEPQLPITRASSMATYPYTSSDDKYFTKDAGPGSKTNKELVKVLSIVSTVGGPIVGKVSASIGNVLALVGVGALVGDMVYTTFYIKFWQAYKLIDSSYWREKQRWFYDSGYYNHVKNRTTYFYNSRPD